MVHPVYIFFYFSLIPHYFGTYLIYCLFIFFIQNWRCPCCRQPTLHITENNFERLPLDGVDTIEIKKTIIHSYYKFIYFVNLKKKRISEFTLLLSFIQSEGK